MTVDSNPTRSHTRPSNERLRLGSVKRSKGSLENFRQNKAQQSPGGHASSLHHGGQNMRVGNVTANGRLELRPVRPLHPPSAFPVTPPHSPHKQTSGLYNDWRRRSFLSNDTAPELRDVHSYCDDASQHRPTTPPQPYVRSYSLSTVSDSLGHGHALTKRDLSFKRKKDALDQPNDAFDGFSGASAQDAQEEAYTSASQESRVLQSTHRDLRSSHPSTRTHQPYAYDSHGGSDRFPAHGMPRMTRSAGPGSPHRRSVMPSASMPERFFPDATITRELEMPVQNGERPLVRTSRIDGQVMAATKAGLIAQITSPDLLDYDLLSDFFLTYRSFMSPGELLLALLTRFTWAVKRADDFGRIVRVRVFVGLRHWILNYFQDDFIPDLELRQEFCSFINDLARELASGVDCGVGDLKVVGELKKCWRRTCAQFWDEDDHRQEGGLEEIRPGGSCESTAVEMKANHSQARANPADPNKRQSGTPSFFNHPFRGRKVPHSSTENAVVRPELHGHRDSDQSTHVTSCSIPIRARHKSRPRTAEPVLSSQAPRAKHNRVPSESLPPSVARSRSRIRNQTTGKLADSLADATIPAQGFDPAKSTQDYFSIPMLSGELIRGLSIKPTLPQVETMFPFTPRGSTSSLSSDDWSDAGLRVRAESHFSGPNPGMKRFLGNMKRALSGKHESFQTLATSAEYHVRTPYRSGQSSSKKSTQKELSKQLKQPPPSQPSRSLPRIDLLAAKILEAFEDLATHSMKMDDVHKPSDASSAERSAQLPWDQSMDDKSFELRRVESSAVTGGSHSIVIVDGTGKNIELPPLPALTSLMHHTRYDQAPRGVSEQTIPVGLDRRTLHYEGNIYSDAQNVVTSPGLPPTHEPSVKALNRKAQTSFPRDSQVLVSETGYESDVADDDQNAADTMHQLKRQPGGNLRKAEHVHSLLARPDTVSTGVTDPGVLQSLASPDSEPMKSASAGADQPPARRKLSLLDTSSAQPKLRASWERAMAKIAQLPDHESDAGIEGALRNLEGPPEREAKQHAEDHAQAVQALGAAQAHEDFRPSTGVSEQTKAEHREDEIFAASPVDEESDREGPRANRPRTFFEEDSRLDLDRLDLDRPVSLASHSSEHPSDVSSIPLIKRGGSGPPRRRPTSSCDWLAVSLPPAKPASPDIAPRGNGAESIEPPTVRRHVRTDATNKLPGSSSTHKSFLLDDEQSLDEPASEAGDEYENAGPADREAGETPDDDARSTFFDDSFSVVTDSGNAVFSHPLRHSATPPQRQIATGFKPLPPSVLDFLPAHELKPRSRGRPLESTAMTLKNEPADPAQARNKVLNYQPNHLPFILGESSIVLAQQFTLIEKDALTGIDWRQLIEMKWSQSATVPETWTKVLQKATVADAQDQSRLTEQANDTGPTAIDLCTDRFNIMVKWAMSEVVLCETADERACCIRKYIHVAAHARQMQNWATMYQITTALLSSDISRLQTTWERVYDEDKATFRQLQKLISPTRNFQNLRTEIENALSAPGNVDHGCIPFLGLYTHDLIYNAQKPKYATPSDSQKVGDQGLGELMINFERQRTAASIVKGLLRVLDASTSYDIEPKPEVLSKCLWMACLSDREIAARSRALEP